MRLTPKSEKEIAEAGLLAEGSYDFEIVDAADTVSKAGNDMIKLTLRVYSDDGAYVVIRDYLLESLAAKLRHAAEACGLLDDYENGRLDADDFKTKTGKVKVGIKKDKDGNYPDQNQIKDYITKPEFPKANTRKPTASASRPAVESDFDDEIPF